jgi:hypothetical protein
MKPEIENLNTEKKRLGEILLDEGAITQDQLSIALREQKNTKNKLLGAILIDLVHFTNHPIITCIQHRPQ